MSSADIGPEEEKVIAEITKELAEIEELDDEIDMHEAKRQSLENALENHREKIKDRRKLIERVYHDAEDDVEAVEKENVRLSLIP